MHSHRFIKSAKSHGSRLGLAVPSFVMFIRAGQILNCCQLEMMALLFSELSSDRPWRLFPVEIKYRRISLD